MATSFRGGRSRSTRREPPTMDKQLVTLITCGCETTILDVYVFIRRLTFRSMHREHHVAWLRDNYSLYSCYLMHLSHQIKITSTMIEPKVERVQNLPYSRQTLSITLQQWNALVANPSPSQHHHYSNGTLWFVTQDNHDLKYTAMGCFVGDPWPSSRHIYSISQNCSTFNTCVRSTKQKGI